MTVQPGIKRFLKVWLINTFAVWVTVYIVPGIHFSRDSGVAVPFITALVLGILNAFIRPILMLLALPLLIFTLGLFTLVINALLLYLVGMLMTPNFQVDNFKAALVGAILISLISMALNVLTGSSRVSVQRQRPPKPPKSDDDGPVIDV